MKGKKIISAVLGFVLAFSLIIPTYNSTDVTKANAAYSVSNKEINKFFGQSAIFFGFLGGSYHLQVKGVVAAFLFFIDPFPGIDDDLLMLDAFEIGVDGFHRI